MPRVQFDRGNSVLTCILGALTLSAAFGSAAMWTYPDTPAIFENPSYIVSVLAGGISETTLKAEAAGTLKRQSMASATGDEYACFVPVKGAADTAHESQAMTRLQTLSTLVNDADRPCTLRMIGYWAYEVCPGRHVRQFHSPQVDKGDSPSSPTVEFTLGAYTAGADKVDTQVCGWPMSRSACMPYKTCVAEAVLKDLMRTLLLDFPCRAPAAHSR
jgi:hypothetical protein